MTINHVSSGSGPHGGSGGSRGGTRSFRDVSPHRQISASKRGREDVFAAFAHLRERGQVLETSNFLFNSVRESMLFRTQVQMYGQVFHDMANFVRRESIVDLNCKDSEVCVKLGPTMNA